MTGTSATGFSDDNHGGFVLVLADNKDIMEF